MGRDGRLYKTISAGPSDKRLSAADLPPANLKRWGYRQKAIVVLAVESGLIPLDSACQRYQMSVEEFLSWERALAKHGIKGLKVSFADRRSDHNKTIGRIAPSRAQVPHEHRH